MSLEPLRTHAVVEDDEEEFDEQEEVRVRAIVRGGEDEVEQEKIEKGCFGSSNLRALWGLLTLNTVFAASQITASLVANSLSLLADSGSMLVDSISYLMSIILEWKKNELGVEATKLWEVYTSAISVLLLIGVTIAAVVDGVHRYKSNHDDAEDVDGKIVFGFATANMVLDIVMCGYYFYQLRGRRQSTIKDQILSETHTQLNMTAAFVHLFADTLRSITGMIAGILEEQTDADPVSVDAIATFVVCSLILLAACFVMYETWVQYKSYRAHRDNARLEGYSNMDDSA